MCDIKKCSKSHKFHKLLYRPFQQKTLNKVDRNIIKILYWTYEKKHNINYVVFKRTVLNFSFTCLFIINNNIFHLRNMNEIENNKVPYGSDESQFMTRSTSPMFSLVLCFTNTDLHILFIVCSSYKCSPIQHQ